MGRLTWYLAGAGASAALTAATVILGAGVAHAHEERDATTPDGSGSVPLYRTEGPTLLVCKTDEADFQARIEPFPEEVKQANETLWAQCQEDGYRHLQEAVDAVDRSGMTIKILPGTYLEEPSLADPSGECASLDAPTAKLGYQVLSWEQQVACPHNQNLVAILDKHDLQIEGTGEKPEDVVIDAQFRRLNTLRADRASGIYLRNFTAQHSTFNAVYIMESDGFVIDTMIGRWTDEYGFLTFADDHGLYANCEAYGNGDSGIYPGAAANINAEAGHEVERYAIEIHHCYSHDNLLGYSGTAGDSVWAHDNVFTENTAGVATDSAFPDHPGLPQNHALFERNVIGDNNKDYYGYVRDGTCARPSAERGYDDGVVCPAVGVPVGTGVINPGGNYNIWRDNWVYGNSYAGFVTSWVPGFVRGETAFNKQFDTSHHNRYYGNQLGLAPDGSASPNGMDFWWDGQGVGSCWQTPSAAGAEPRVLPRCGEDGLPAGFGTARYVGDPVKTLKLYRCADYDLTAQRIPSDCDWFGAAGLGRFEVRYALVQAILLALIMLLILRRLLRGSAISYLGLVLILGGLAAQVYGTLREATLFTPAGLAALGLGWACFGIALRRRGRPGLGFLTLALGFFALLGGVDRGLFMLPWIPVPPSVWLLALELFWVPIALVAAARGPVLATTAGRGEDDLTRYAAHLRT